MEVRYLDGQCPLDMLVILVLHSDAIGLQLWTKPVNVLFVLLDMYSLFFANLQTLKWLGLLVFLVQQSDAMFLQLWAKAVKCWLVCWICILYSFKIYKLFVARPSGPFMHLCLLMRQWRHGGPTWNKQIRLNQSINEKQKKQTIIKRLEFWAATHT